MAEKVGAVTEASTEGIGKALGEWFDKNGITVEELQKAIDEGRSLIRDAVKDLPEQTTRQARLVKGNLLKWDTDEYILILQSLAKTHPQHAKLLQTPKGWWRFYLPQLAEAKKIIERL